MGIQENEVNGRAFMYTASRYIQGDALLRLTQALQIDELKVASSQV